MTSADKNLPSFFRDTAPYIQMHRGKTFVIALSGEVLKHDTAGEILQDIALLSTLGIRVILVHGARPQIEEQLANTKHVSEIHNGTRITDSKTLELSKAAIGATRLEIENLLNRALNKPPIISNSLGILSGNFLTAKPMGVIDGIDYQHTGKIRKIKKKLIKLLLSEQNIILLSPLGYSPTGQVYNLRYEDIAGATAEKIKADKLIFIQDGSKTANLPKQLNLKAFNKIKLYPQQLSLIAAKKAMNNGVSRTHFIDIRTTGGLLLELYTRDGVGRMIDNTHYDEPRNATIDDISGILELIRPLEASGILAKRSREQLEIEINNFSVIERDNKIIGCAALRTYQNNENAELYCLAINDKYRSGNRGTQLCKHVANRATQLGIDYLFILTTQSVDWFLELGFVHFPIDKLPERKKKLYNASRKSKPLRIPTSDIK